ncbi:dTDP-4-dehydrorhamnose reductase [Paenibacillus sp. P1XP2]|nr:dTDP-4-dehydrorhamnose reductase [Paenibacillus sp. P1XP2]
MRVLVTGASGQLGKDVVALFEQKGHEVMGCSRSELDITNLEQCQQVIGGFQPDSIIHCAAYTAVDAAETDVDGAYKVNAVGTRNVAVAAEKIGAKLVYISTDYVFNGRSSAPYLEYDNTDRKVCMANRKEPVRFLRKACLHDISLSAHPGSTGCTGTIL